PIPTELYTLSLHDALPISCAEKRAVLLDGRIVVARPREAVRHRQAKLVGFRALGRIGEFAQPKPPGRAVILRFIALKRALCQRRDRKSTRLNSSHLVISYA